MKTRFKKMLSLALTMILVLSAVPFAALTAGAATTYAVGDIIEFGGYPQSRVTDANTVAALNAKVTDGDWQSYGYYSGDGNYGSMVQGDWMKYCDIYLNGNKYRGVTFSQYRPAHTYRASSAANSLQDDNGYTTGTNYWFLWETLRWRVLDPSAGLVLCESIIDSQAFQSETIQSGNEYFIKSNSTVYANNYAQSTIRNWLTNIFYQTAFTSTQQTKIKATALNNDAYDYNLSDPIYASTATNDKIFLLSGKETINASYGFDANRSAYDEARNAQGTDYAKCQGLVVNNNHSHWILRNARETTNRMSSVGAGGFLLDFEVTGANLGTRPAFTFKSGIVVSPYSVGCGHTETTFVNNGDGTHSKKCTFCDLTLETAAHRMGRNIQTNDNGHLTDCPDCGARFTYVHDDKGSMTTISGTCATPGQIKYRCSVTSCPYFGRTEETGTNAANHAGPYTDQEAVAATCTMQGSTRGQFCTACNQWKTAPQTTDPDPANHVNTADVPETDSTCIAHGYTAGVWCNDCETWVSGHEEKTFADHVWNVGETVKEATCVSMGDTKYTCTVPGCGATEIRTDVPENPDNHVNTEEFAETGSKCYEAGYTAGVYCNDCETWVSGHEEKPLAEHSWQEIEKVKATCRDEGYILWGCAVKSCGATKREVLERDPDAHDFKVTVYPPTCTDDGYTSHACTLCRYGYADDVQPALGHSWNAPVWSWSGTSSALATFTCANGDHPVTLSATVTSETVKAPTDTEAGKTVYTATVAFEGVNYTDTVEKTIPALDDGLCKWCGERHEGFWGKIIGFFHRILYFFAHLFGQR